MFVCFWNMVFVIVRIYEYVCHHILLHTCFCIAVCFLLLGSFFLSFFSSLIFVHKQQTQMMEKKRKNKKIHKINLIPFWWIGKKKKNPKQSSHHQFAFVIFLVQLMLSAHFFFNSRKNINKIHRFVIKISPLQLNSNGLIQFTNRNNCLSFILACI